MQKTSYRQLVMLHQLEEQAMQENLAPDGLDYCYTSLLPGTDDRYRNASIPINLACKTVHFWQACVRYTTSMMPLYQHTSSISASSSKAKEYAFYTCDNSWIGSEP